MELEAFSWDEVESIEEAGEGDCWDIGLVEDDTFLGEPNFIANGIVVHNCKMHERYVERKAGREPVDIHPLLKPILGPTYGVMVFQETVMKILNIVGKIPLKDCEKVRKAISKKKMEQIEKYREGFVQNGQEVLGQSKEKLEEFFEQILSFSEYGFNKSHSVAYTYVSSRLLFLKAHYPLEFYCGTLMCQDDTGKIKDYKLDAMRHGVEVRPVDINLSKENFSIQVGPDGKDVIYYGMSNLKGIGDVVAKKIVAGQPYVDISDFLERFGTDAKVCATLILLDAFKGDRVLKLKYYEFYKHHLKKMVDRDKRHMKSRADYVVKLRDCLIKHDLLNSCNEDDLSFENRTLYEGVAKEGNKLLALDEIQKLGDTFDKFVAKHDKKVADGYIPSIEDFNPDNVEVEEKHQLLLDANISEAERLFYGFQWVHDLEKCKHYKGDRTFEDFRHYVSDGGTASVYPVEVKIMELITKTTKAGKPMYVLKVEDAVGEAQGVTVWSEDYERFKEEFVAGSLLSMRVHPPQVPFPNFTFDSPLRHLRHRLPPKNEDVRVFMYKKDG